MKKRNMIILIILLAVGFASVSTTLVLNGIVGIGSSEDEFDVIFTSAKINGEGSNVTISENKKKITFSSSKLTNVGEKAILDYKIKNNSTQYDADVTINCTNEASEYISVTNELEGEEITDNFKTTFTSQEEKSGAITAELIKSAVDESDSVEVTCTIVASATERDSIGKPFEPIENNLWKITEDNDGNGKVSNGDLITLGTESFYVYNVEGEIIKALAQYNLYVGYMVLDSESNEIIPLYDATGLQNIRARGEIFDSDGKEVLPRLGILPFMNEHRFSSLNSSQKGNDYTISTIKECVDAYAVKLTQLGCEEKTVRLIDKEELEILGCDSSQTTCAAAPKWVYSSSYWTSSPYIGFNNCAWFVSSSGTFDGDRVDDGHIAGVRPVVEIPKSEFE